MGKIPNELKMTIANNIKACRLKKFPGRGGGKKCAQTFGVSPQQWSPWERGMRTPDELRLKQIADFFEVTVEYLRRDNSEKPAEYGTGFPGDMLYATDSGHAPILREPDAPPYGLPSLRKDESPMPLTNVSELSHVSARLLELVCTTTKGVVNGKYDVGKSIIVLRRLGDILEQKVNEVEAGGGVSAPVPVPLHRNA